jgi:hypothetical protein
MAQIQRQLFNQKPANACSYKGAMRGITGSG